MVKVWFVVILLFLGAAAGFLGFAADFGPYYSFKKGAKVAQARPASKTQEAGRSIIKYDEARYEYPLRFKTDSGRDIFANAFVPARALDKLKSDGQVNVLYLPDEPERILFEGDIQRMPRGWWSLILGIAALVVGIAVLRRRSKLAPYTKYLGRSSDGSE